MDHKWDQDIDWEIRRAQYAEEVARVSAKWSKEPTTKERNKKVLTLVKKLYHRLLTGRVIDKSDLTSQD